MPSSTFWQAICNRRFPGKSFRWRYLVKLAGVIFLFALLFPEIGPVFGQADVQLTPLNHTVNTVDATCRQLVFTSDGNPFGLCPGPAPAGGNCVWWGWEQWHLLGYNLPLDWGNAADWIVDAERAGLPLGTTPRVGAIAVFPRADGVWAFGPPGHVAFVTAVSSDGQSFNVTYQNYGDPTPMYTGIGYSVPLIQEPRFQNGMMRFIYFPRPIDPKLFARLPGINGNNADAINHTNALLASGNMNSGASNITSSNSSLSSANSQIAFGLPPLSSEQEFNADFTGSGFSDLLLYNRAKGTLSVMSLSGGLQHLKKQHVPRSVYNEVVGESSTALPLMVNLSDSTTPVNGWGSSLDIHIGNFSGGNVSEILLYDRVSGKLQLLSLTPQLTIKKHVTLDGFGPGWELYVGNLDGRHSTVFMYNRLINSPLIQSVTPTPTDTSSSSDTTTSGDNPPTTGTTPIVTPPASGGNTPPATPTRIPSPTPTPGKTPTPTPSPTPTQAPSPTPTPGPSPTPTQAPSPTPTPDPTPTQAPEATPTSVATPHAGTTPTATATPGVITTPAPTSTPRPTPRPTVTKTPTPKPTPTVLVCVTVTPGAKSMTANSSCSSPTATRKTAFSTAPVSSYMLLSPSGGGGGITGSGTTLDAGSNNTNASDSQSLQANVMVFTFDKDFNIQYHQQYTLSDNNWEVNIGRFVSAEQDAVFLYDRVAGQAQIISFGFNLHVAHQKKVDNLSSNWEVHSGDFEGIGRSQVLLYDPSTGDGQILELAPDLSVSTQKSYSDWGSNQVLYIGHFGLPTLSVMLYDPQSQQSTFLAFDSTLEVAHQYTVKSWDQRYQVLIGNFLDRSRCLAAHNCTTGDDILVLNRQTGQMEQYVFSFGNQVQVFDNRSQSFIRNRVSLQSSMLSVDTTTFSLLTTLNTSIRNEELY